jgi:predicted transcriptional regulator
MRNYQVVSVKQPWASLLLAGVKKYEVRGWAPPYLGYIVLHASSGKAWLC